MATGPRMNSFWRIQFSAVSCAQEENARMQTKTSRPVMICQARVPLAIMIRR